MRFTVPPFPIAPPIVLTLWADANEPADDSLAGITATPTEEPE